MAKNSEVIKKLKDENEKLIKKLEDSSMKYMELMVQVQELTEANAELAKKKVICSVRYRKSKGSI